MSRWTIYDKDGNALHESIVEYDGKGKVVYQDTFEYVGKWMGECYLTVSIKSPYPIDFQIGDYIEYRGEKFTINYDPTVIKKARRGTYGEGFVYDSIKFNSYSNELTMMLFHDWVLDDNKVHYTSLPAFSFYAKDVDDLADRLQACADRWCKDNGRGKGEYWMFYTLANNTQGTKDTGQYQTTYERTVQRAKDISTDSAFLSAVQSEWTKTYGNPSDYKDSRDDERYDRNISISNNTVWDGLQKVKTEFGLNFIIRGRNVYIGTVGVPTSHLFEYGKGKGLYEVDKTADTDQKVVTRLHAYGSDQNMPTRYYAEVTSEAFSTIKEIKENPTDYSFARFTLDLPYSSRYFTNAMTKYGSNIYAVGIKVGDILVNARVEGTDNNGYVEIYSECLQNSTDDDDNTDFANFGQFKSAIAVGVRIFFTKGVDRSAFPISNIGFEDGVKALPDNMAVNSLMLPGFPLYSLADICKSVYDSASNSTNYYIKKKPSGTDDEYVLFHTESGKHVVSFSDDRHDPYIVSQNAASLGYRDGDISCTESNDDNGLEAVYPSIEKITESDAGVGNGTTRLDVIDSADTIDDNGVYDKEGVSVPSFHVTLPKLGFDLRQAAKDANNSGEFKLSMKDGFCGGREFTAKVESVDASTGKITLRVQRSYDDSLSLWFPYSYAKSVQAVGPGMTNAYQILPGDHFVLTGINVSDVNYVWAASVKLLRKAIHWLCKNDYTRYVYTPKIDEIFMARQDLEAKSDTSGKTASIHDTLKEGDVLLFDDDDLLINGSVYIDQLTIKENGNNGIPTYDVTLRNEVNVGTLQRIQNKVDSVANDIRTGNIGGNVGMTPTQVDPLVKAYGAKYFLSKLSDDTAQGLITFAKGLISDMLAKLNGGATFGTGGYKFDEKGNVVVDALSSRGFDEALERGFGVTKNSRGKYTLSVTDLMVWGKAVFNSLEIRKLYAVGGNVYLSGASSKIVRAVPVKRATAAASSTGVDASAAWVACAEGDADCEGWKCYTLNDDGTTATQNGWRKYDQAKCQTFDIEAGAHEGVSNTFYWRLVADVSMKNETITETRTETYVDDDGVTKTREVTVDLYDGKKFGWVVLSKTDCESTTNDAPKAGDTIVLDGHRMFASGDADGRDQYNDESRTNVMMLETTGTENGTLPRIVALTGIVDYRHWDGVNPYSNTVFILSPKEVVFVSSSFKFMSASGDPITLVNFRGNWAKGTKYGYYDQVSHNDSIWTCIVTKGDTTNAEPSDTSTDWRKEISGGKGDPAVTYELVASPSYIKLDADGSFDRSNQYREGQMLLVRGYKIVGGKRITQWGDADNPISIQISFNDGAAWYESTFNNGESRLDEVYNDFEPTCEDSYFSMLQEMKKNGLKNCKAVMYEGESLDPDKIPSDKVLARIDIPIVQDGKDGASGTSYGVTLTVEKRTISSVEDDCLVVTFTKGDTDGVTTTNNVQDIGGYAQLYVDGKIDTSATARLNLGTSEAGELQKGAFPQVFTAGYVTVKWYDKEGGTLLGTGSLTRGADGKDATVYGVQVGSYYKWTSGGKLPGLEFGFTKTTGATVGKATDVRNIGCTVMIYGDGTYYSSASGWINEGNGNFLFSTFPYGDKDGNPTLGDASVVCVELYLDGMLVATANYANGKQGADGPAATVYTIEAVGNYNNNSGTLVDASTIGVTLTGDLKLYKTVGSEKTEDSKPPQCWRLTVGGKNVDGTIVFTNTAGNNIVTYQYYNTYKKDSNGNIAVPGSATISVYKDSSMGELLASLVIPITLNPGAIVNVDAKLGKIESTTASMKGTIETIQQGQGQISLKVQDLQNGGVDTSKPHTSSQVDFRTLDADSFYPVMIRFKDDGGVRHTVEISRNLDGTYGSGKDYMTHSQGFSFRLIFSDIANGWGTNEDGQLHIESISQRWTEPTDTPICPKIAQYYPFSFTLAWLRGGSKYDITVDCTDAHISGIWPYMMQVASNPSWVPDAVRLAPDTWTTAQVNAQGGNPYNMLRKDNGGYYADVDNEYLYRFGELAAGNTFAIVGQPKDSKVWFMATWHITSVSGSKVYVDVSTYGLLWQAQNPLGIRMMGVLGYIKTGASYPKSTWDSQNGFGTSENVDNTAVHADWAVPRAILVIGKESSATNGVYRDRAVLEAVQSCTEGSSVSFYSNTYFDVSPLYGTDGRTNVKPDLLATGIDIKSHKIVATADNFVVRNNRGEPTFSVDEEGNIVGSGGASFNGPMKATTFTLNSTYFSVKEDGTITAKGGQISFFYFDAEGMASTVEYDSSQNKPWRGIGLSSNNISVSGYTGQRISSVFLGKGLIDSRFAGSDKNYIVHRVGSTSSASTFYNYIKLERFEDGHDSYENDPEYAALGIETQGDFCLAALGGPSLFAGMCFASDTVGSSYTADKEHCFYLCSGGTFNMPSNPPDGMLIVVIQKGSSRINFNGNGHRFQSGTYNSLSFTSDSAGQWSLFYYHNEVWYTIYMTR